MSETDEKVIPHVVIFSYFFVALRGIVGTCICSAVFGVLYLLALLFAIPDVAKFMTDNNNQTETMNLVARIFENILSRNGAVALTVILIINVHLSGATSMTVASRIG